MATYQSISRQQEVEQTPNDCRAFPDSTEWSELGTEESNGENINAYMVRQSISIGCNILKDRNFYTRPQILYNTFSTQKLYFFQKTDIIYNFFFSISKFALYICSVGSLGGNDHCAMSTARSRNGRAFV
jgi:hypothetical protein